MGWQFNKLFLEKLYSLGISGETLDKALSDVILELRSRNDEEGEDIAICMMDQLIGWCGSHAAVDFDYSPGGVEQSGSLSVS